MGFVFTNFQSDNYGTSSGDDEENCTIEEVEMLILNAEVMFMKTVETERGGGTCLKVGVTTLISNGQYRCIYGR